jgi:hypothetical protein
MAAEAGRELLLDGLSIVRDLEPAALARDCKQGDGSIWHGAYLICSLLLCVRAEHGGS